MGLCSPDFFKRLTKGIAQALEEMATTVSCASVANYFLERASKEGRALTALQMNYLLYLAHGWHLAYFDKPLLNEGFLAGRHGIKPIYFHAALAKWGKQGIRKPFRSGPICWTWSFLPLCRPKVWRSWMPSGTRMRLWVVFSWPGYVPPQTALGHEPGKAAQSGL